MKGIEGSGRHTLQRDNAGYLLLSCLFSAFMLVWFLLICTTDCQTFDNDYQYFLNRHAWKDMFDFILVDYSPPLYSVVLKIYTQIFGENLITMRVLGLIFLCSHFFMAFFPLRRLMGKECAITASCIFLASSYNFYWGVTIRPAILAYVLTTGMYIYAMLSVFQGSKADHIKFTVFSLLCMYTHNVSLIAAFCVYGSTIIIALIRKDFPVFKRFLISGITVAILYIPWLIVLLSQVKRVSEHFWGNDGSLLYALYFSTCGYVGIRTIGVPTRPIVAFILLMPVINVFLLIKKENIGKDCHLRDLFPVREAKKEWRNTDRFLYLLLIVLLSATAFYLVTVFVAPFYARRYFFIYSGGGIILVSCLATMCKKREVPAIILICAIFCSCLVNTSSERQIVTSCTKDDMIRDILQDSNGHPEILHIYEETLGVTAYYFPDARHYVTDDIKGVLPNFDVFGADTVYLHNGDDVWEYSDEVYIFSQLPFDLYDIGPYEYFPMFFDTPDSIRMEEFGHYYMPYTNDIAYGTYELTVYKVTRV